MEIKKLSDVSFIDISGVDKKTEIGEKRVRLCNFTDVYYNWSVDRGNISDFMEASASDNEIQRFSLKKGSVAITKDSETRDDIGIACYIADDLDNTVLGYHTALIIPNEKELDGSYLNAYLHTSTARKYFSNQASGSGQRYTLTIKGIGSVKIPIIDLDEQKRIGHLFETIENKIKANNSINVELESMAKTLYDYWFLQFEFPNEEGKPYKSSGGKMVYNEKLKMDIPEGWTNGNIIDNTLCKAIQNGVDYFQKKNYLPTANINGEEIEDGEYVTFENRESRANMQPTIYSVWFAKMKNSIKHLSIPKDSKWFIEKYILSTGFEGLQCNEESFGYIHCFINSNYFEMHKDILAHGATQESVNDGDLKSIKFIIPSNAVIKEFSKIINPMLNQKFNNIRENQELSSLRDFLLPLLMNGQVTFKDGE